MNEKFKTQILFIGIAFFHQGCLFQPIYIFIKTTRNRILGDSHSLAPIYIFHFSTAYKSLISICLSTSLLKSQSS